MTSKNPIVQKVLNATTKTYDPSRRPSVIVGEINRKCPKLSAKVDAWFVWVEFRDKKGVKGRLSDAIMAEPGFPRDKLEVARADADGVLFTVKGSPCVNAKFAVTTKSGRSVVIEAPNYKAAEKEAKRRFGAGCIVDLVGNSEVATNAKFEGWFTTDSRTYWQMAGSFGTVEEAKKAAIEKCQASLKKVNGLWENGKWEVRRDVDKFGPHPPIPADRKGWVFHNSAQENIRFGGDQDYATVVKYNPSNDSYDVKLEDGEVAHPKASILAAANATPKAKNSTRNYEMKSTNPIVQKALNATVAKNANEPLIRYIKSNIQTKFPQSSLEGDTDGATHLFERRNGRVTILADRKARPALDQLKAKFEPDYIFAFVDYGRGATGFTMTPRAHTKRGEFKVANAVAMNAEGNADDFAYKAGNLFHEAAYTLGSCEYYLERLSTLGKPNDVKGNDAKTQAWAKDKLKKVRELKAKFNQGRL